jgi:RHS repeat-associated protein
VTMELAEAKRHRVTDASVAENSRLGFRVVFAGIHPAIEEVKPNIASGIEAELRRDDIRSRSTGKERDTENGLDYFGARYMSAGQGRFTSVDPSRASATPSDPQSWNRFAYVLNNRKRVVDTVLTQRARRI